MADEDEKEPYRDLERNASARVPTESCGMSVLQSARDAVEQSPQDDTVGQQVEV